MGDFGPDPFEDLPDDPEEAFLVLEEHFREECDLGGLSSKPIFDAWDHPTYARYLAAFMGTDVERVSSPDGSLVTTWLHDKENKRVRIPIRGK